MSEMQLPDYFSQGEYARIFPPLSQTSREVRATSILLGVMNIIPALADTLLEPFKVKLGKRAKVRCFTEVVFKAGEGKKQRPDGFVEVQTSSSKWSCIVEAKIGNSYLEAGQLDAYRQLAREHKINGLLTISNQLTSSPTLHPLSKELRKLPSVELIHWSWMEIVTKIDLLIGRNTVSDHEQGKILEELRRFLVHDETGVAGFTKMPPEWGEINKIINGGGAVSARSPVTLATVNAWHQETKDICLIMSRKTKEMVAEVLSKKDRENIDSRVKADTAKLADQTQLDAKISIPGAADHLSITADLRRRTISAAMTLGAPTDRKSNVARLNWLLRQIEKSEPDNVFVEAQWPGSSKPTAYELSGLRLSPSLIEKDRTHLTLHSFRVYMLKDLAGRFAQLQNFIVELEALVPDFYQNIGQNLRAWQKPAPKIESVTEQIVDQVGLNSFDKPTS